jgi:hypothetical protein
MFGLFKRGNDALNANPNIVSSFKFFDASSMQWPYSEPPYLNVLEEQLLIRFAVPLPYNLPD